MSTYARKETVLGNVVASAGVERIAPLRAGIVSAVYVRPGALVKPGQPLFELNYSHALKDGSTVSGQLLDTVRAEQAASDEQAGLKKARAAATMAATQARMTGLESDATGLDEQIRLQQARIEQVEADIASVVPLVDKGYVARNTLMQKKDLLLQVRQSLLALQQRRIEDRTQIEELRSQQRENRLVMAEADADGAVASAQIREKRLNTMASLEGQVSSRVAGRVTSLQAHPGDLVDANQTVALVVAAEPERTVSAELWVPSRAIGFVRPGTPVRVMFDAFPFQTFGVGHGHVVEVAGAPLLPQEVPTPINAREQMYRVLVRLDESGMSAYGQTRPLLAGMRLSADVILEKRTLLSGLLDPLLAIQKRNGP